MTKEAKAVAWYLADIRRIDPPFPVRGSLGLFDVEYEEPPLALPKRLYWNFYMGVPLPAGAVFVGRPSKYGNEFKLKGCRCRLHPEGGGSHTREEAVQLYVDWRIPELRALGLLAPLKGRDLVCPGCKPDQKPCHGDALIQAANP